MDEDVQAKIQADSGRDVGEEKEKENVGTKQKEAATKGNTQKESADSTDEDDSDLVVNGDSEDKLAPSIHVNEGGYAINHK